MWTPNLLSQEVTGYAPLGEADSFIRISIGKGPQVSDILPLCVALVARSAVSWFGNRVQPAVGGDLFEAVPSTVLAGTFHPHWGERFPAYVPHELG